MFETRKTLIVVYKDELLINQLKKMVETHDDNGQSIVGTRDDSINIVSWAEKVWLGNKKAGNIQGKILFLGDIKGTDKLIPVIDVKFDECGVKFGWAGNQAIVYADPKVLTTRESYDGFLDKLSALPVPEFLKAKKESMATTGADFEAEAKVVTPQVTADALEDADTGVVEDDSQNKPKKFKSAKEIISSGAEIIEKMGTQVVSKSEEIFRNKSLMKRQMLFYGVVRMYNDGLEAFLNM